MDINQANQAIINSILNALDKGKSNDEMITAIRECYEGIHNNFFQPAQKYLEIFLFRFYEIKFFQIEKWLEEFDRKRYLTDEAYYQEKWKEIDGKWDSEVSAMLYDLGVYNVEMKDLEKAGVFFREAAILGDSDGQYNYGITLTNGEGVTPDTLQGSFWYWEAAKHGNSKAMLNLAIAYRNGDGVRVDNIQMLYWYVKSASTLENPKAVYNLGLTLKYEEVIEGTADIGEILIESSGYMDNEEVRDFITNLTSRMLQVLQETVYNAN